MKRVFLSLLLSLIVVSNIGILSSFHNIVTSNGSQITVSSHGRGG
ncbi:hypothetical protein QOZ95_000863 [Paenibacillus brasilensis]|uniref:Uncharacterized protein n=1 Tax=Paenibacillus brasilensis TaxID=128574 RepID=A0ABU0KX96_9BACL|nr:hypothetical protein [Paenibacillus brasilensis]